MLHTYFYSATLLDKTTAGEGGDGTFLREQKHGDGTT